MQWEGTETVDSSIRASAFAGIGAFALSIIVAIFSRVPFGVLLLRALLSGAGFAVLTYAAIWLLKRFLPEIFDAEIRTVSQDSEGDLGRVVDIVLPGAEADPGETDGDVSLSPRIASADQARSRIEAPGSHAPDSGDLEREVAGLRSDVLIANDPSDASSSGGGMAPRPSVALDELDTLPDLDGFSDSFSEALPGGSGAAEGTERDASLFMGASDSMPTAGAPDAGKDPAVLAKAVQTLLRRDQKG